MTRGLATLESRGVIEKATAHPTLPRAWSVSETGGEERMITYKRAGSILL
jgi:hypothetical protein